MATEWIDVWRICISIDVNMYIHQCVLQNYSNFLFSYLHLDYLKFLYNYKMQFYSFYFSLHRIIVVLIWKFRLEVFVNFQGYVY